MSYDYTQLPDGAMLNPLPVSLRLTPELLEEIDRRAALNERNRSGQVRIMLKEYIEEHPED